MDQNVTQTEKKPSGFVAHIAKNRYIYIFVASVLVFAILTGVAFVIDAAVSDLSGIKFASTEGGFFDMMRGMLYNEGKISIMGIFQILVRVAAIVGILVFFALSSGSYQIGFTPLAPAHPAWNIALLVSLILLAPSAIYSMFAANYFWSVLLGIAMPFSDALLIAFSVALLRRAKVKKSLRVWLPLIGSYVYYGIYLVLAMLPSFSGYSGLDILTTAFPPLVIYAYIIIAPLFMVSVYNMTNSIMAMVLPMATLTISFGLFPGVIATFKELTYPIILFLLAVVACVACMVAMTVLLVKKLMKKIPLPTDLLCEAYEEGAPEVTFPEGYEKEVKVKKEKKEKKVQKKNDFAFLEDQSEESAKEEETQA